MWSLFSDGFEFLSAQSWSGLLALFWFSLLFDVPRYTFAFLTAVLFISRRNLSVRGRAVSADEIGRISVVMAGHNEADSIERCVRSMREQSYPPDEIIVISDGSTDGMEKKIRAMQIAGEIDVAHSTHLRAGKSAALNLGERWATGDIIVIADCDSTYHRHALRNAVAPLADPAIGAVSGNILVRNPRASLITRFQAIEYLISISLGKQAAALTDQVTCVSGAFGAFRRSAIDAVNGVDVGGGEDFDLTLKLRKLGWRIAFAEDAICYTDVPVTVGALVRQRFRWERDTVRLRYRKHADLMNPFSRRFDLKEFFHEFEFLLFHVVAAAALPIYLIWLFLTYGDYAWMILFAVQAGLFFIDLLSFVLASLATPQAATWRLLPYTLGYSLFNGFLMRNVRLASYFQEWIFNASAKDEYVPAKVRITRRW